MSSTGRGFQGWSQESLEGSGWSGNGGREGEARGGSRDQKAQISSSRIEEDLFIRSEEVARVEEEARKIGYEVERAAIKAGKPCLEHGTKDCLSCRWNNWWHI